MNLILLRHGEIDSNFRKIYSGRSDEPLNVRGRQQAADAAAQLRQMNIAALFASPLRRTVETATIIGRQLELSPQLAPAFNELAMGPWEGLSEDEVEQRFPVEFSLWNSRPADLCLDGRETLEALQNRVLAGVALAHEQVGNRPFCIVSHVAVIRVLMLYAEGRPLNDYKKIHVPNATPVSLSFDGAVRFPSR